MINPEDLVEQLRAHPADFGLDKVRSAVKESGGVVHHVYRVETGEATYYLKLRDVRFAALPQIVSRPADIAHEHTALVALAQLFPEHFPHVVSYRPGENFIEMTDVLAGGETLQRLFLDGAVAPSAMHTLGVTLRRIHEALRGLKLDLRRDADFYDLKLLHRLGHLKNRVIDQAVAELQATPTRQYILGDASPKNTGLLHNGQVIFFDLEDFHMGNLEFELGYVLGHLLLHAGAQPAGAAHPLAFLEGYGVDELALANAGLVMTVAVGTMLYRLNSIVVPYELGAAPGSTPDAIARLEALLAAGNAPRAGWEAFVAMACGWGAG